MLEDTALTIRTSTLFIYVAIALYSGQALAQKKYVITLPKHSELTPVQRLNREGVKAIAQHDYPAAEALFYQAYLFDPADPFTLNNLAYISQIDGSFDRAEQFYELAAEQGSNATIQMSDVKRLEGQPMRDALVDLHDVKMSVNHGNIQATQLLEKGRGFEALVLLRHILSRAPHDPFTLNNLGVACETVGDYDDALKYYREAAAQRSMEPVAVSPDSSSLGNTISANAEANATRLALKLRGDGTNIANARILATQGVFAATQNNRAEARKDFLRAYTLAPGSAFALNNRGWLAETDGDLEAAQFYYWKAQNANDAALRVGNATRPAAEGETLDSVAAESNNKVDDALDRYSRERKDEHASPQLVLPPNAH